MLATTTAAVFALLAMLHFYWAVGGQTGKIAAIPEHDGIPVFRPSRAGTAGVGLVLLGAAAIVLMHLEVLLAGGAAVLMLRAIGDFRLVGFFKRVRGTAFARADTLLYSPLCLALGVALAALATS